MSKLNIITVAAVVLSTFTILIFLSSSTTSAPIKEQTIDDNALMTVQSDKVKPKIASEMPKINVETLKMFNGEGVVSAAKSTVSLEVSESMIHNDTPVDTDKLPEVKANYFKCFAKIGYTPTDAEMLMFCTVVSSETGYCEDRVQKAVAHTIINRVLSDKFPNNIYEVVTQENQYTAIHSYFDGEYRKDLHPGSELWNHSMDLCLEALNEYDFTYGAVAYYNPSINGYNAWFEQFQLTYQDKYGRFFRL